MEFKGLVNSAKKAIDKNSPEILAGIGVAGMIFTVIEAVRATPKALDILEDYRYNNDLSYDDKIPVKVIVKSCWKVYAPTFILGICSAGSMIGSTTISHRRNVALAAACSIAERTLDTYKNKVIEELGEDVHQKIEDTIYKERAEEDYERVQSGSVKENIIETGNGGYLFMDCMSGQKFRSCKEAIDGAVNEYNRTLIKDQWTELNEFYDLLGIDRTDAGHILGHDIYKEALNVRYIGNGMYGNEPLTIIKYDAEALKYCDAYCR